MGFLIYSPLTKFNLFLFDNDNDLKMPVWFLLVDFKFLFESEKCNDTASWLFGSNQLENVIIALS